MQKYWDIHFENKNREGKCMVLTHKAEKTDMGQYSSVAKEDFKRR